MLVSSNASSFRRLLLTSAVALVVASPAVGAQEGQRSPSTGATIPGASDDTSAGNDVIVTARNRDEKLQDVPLAITAISSQQLQNANVRNLRDVSYLTPGLVLNGGGSEFLVNPIIRGQTNLNGGAGDPNVAVFIDGVYISNNSAINVGLIDIDRIEVVKGPVSSLYGRNAFAGAINYVSKKPSTREASGSVTAFVGNDGQRSLAGSLSYPLVKDVLGVRIAAGYEHFGGSYKDEVNGNRAGGFLKRDIQASLRFTPSSSLTIDGSYYYGNDKFDPSALTYNQLNCGARLATPAVTDPSGTGYTNGTSGTGFCGHFDPDAHAIEVPNVPALSGASGNSRKVNLASFTVGYDLGFGRLTSLTGYTKVTQQRFTDFIGRRNGIPFVLTPVPPAPLSQTVNLLELFGSNINTRDFSEEIRFQSQPDKPFRFELGGFYYKGRNGGQRWFGESEQRG